MAAKGEVCYLILEDGCVLTGESFGARKQTDGEVGKCQHVVGMFSEQVVNEQRSLRNNKKYARCLNFIDRVFPKF